MIFKGIHSPLVVFSFFFLFLTPREADWEAITFHQHAGSHLLTPDAIFHNSINRSEESMTYLCQWPDLVLL